MRPHPQIPFTPALPNLPPADSLARAQSFHSFMNLRRSVRFFSDQPVPQSIIESCILAAGTAPSGANKQPWRFVAVSDPLIKREIRLAAEIEEREFYSRRASKTWLNDLAILGTDDQKPFLEIAPWLIVVFKLMKDDLKQNNSDQVYYVNESVGIATGFLLAALHHAGLVALTHTPSPMKFLPSILHRPEFERPFLLIPVGYPAPDCTIPDIRRKSLSQIMSFNRD